jgi:hypothetical protein
MSLTIHRYDTVHEIHGFVLTNHLYTRKRTPKKHRYESIRKDATERDVRWQVGPTLSGDNQPACTMLFCSFTSTHCYTVVLLWLPPVSTS